MVFGLGKKEIELNIDKYNYSQEETIKGKIKLDLKKPVEGRGLRVDLIGETWRTTVTRGRAHRSRSRICWFRMPLDGEKVYTTGEYNFEIKISDAIRPISEGMVGKITGAIESLAGIRYPIWWYVQAVIDRPMRGDITSKRIEIFIK